MKLITVCDADAVHGVAVVKIIFAY